MLKYFSLILLVFFLNVSFSQEENGDIEIYLNKYISGLPGSNDKDYQAPTMVELNTWNNAMDHFFSGALSTANSLVNLMNYEIVEFIDTSYDEHTLFYLIREKTPLTKYWGTYVISANPVQEKIVLQAPHPVYDKNTGYEAVFCFKRLIPKAVFISGTHRCNHTDYSVCSGTTSVCGDQSAYRISDNAHNTTSVFQKMTEILYQKTEETVFIQLHGFSKRETDPYVIMSNGTRITPEVDYAYKLKEEFQKIDPVLSCKIAHLDTDWYRLIGFTNTQGRFINHSSDPCFENGVSSEGRFIHIEQERIRLRSDSMGWYKMYKALEKAFAEEVSAEELASTRDIIPLQLFPNPNNGSFTVLLEEPAQIRIYSMNGVLKYFSGIEDKHHLINISGMSEGLFLIQAVSKTKMGFSRFFVYE